MAIVVLNAGPCWAPWTRVALPLARWSTLARLFPLEFRWLALAGVKCHYGHRGAECWAVLGPLDPRCTPAGKMVHAGKIVPAGIPLAMVYGGYSNAQRRLIQRKPCLVAALKRAGDGDERAGWRILDQGSRQWVAQWIHEGLESNGEHPTQRPMTSDQHEYIARMLNVHEDELPDFIKRLTNEEAKAAIVILQHLTDNGEAKAMILAALHSTPATKEQLTEWSREIRYMGHRGPLPATQLALQSSSAGILGTYFRLKRDQEIHSATISPSTALQHQPLPQPLHQPMQQTIQKHMQQTMEQPLHQPLHQSLHQPAQQSPQQHMQQPLHKPLHKPMDQPLQQPVDQPLHQPLHQPMQQPTQQPMQTPLHQPAQQPMQQPMPTVVAQEDSDVPEDSVSAEDSDVAEDFVASKDSDVPEYSVAPEDSDVPEYSVAPEDSDVAEDFVASEDSDVAENFVASEDSDVAEDSVAAEDSDVAEDFVESEDSDVAENFVASEDSDVAEDSVAAEDSDVAEDFVVPESSVAAEDSDAPEDSVSAEDSAVAKNCVASEYSDVAEDSIASEDSDVAEDSVLPESSVAAEDSDVVEDFVLAEGYVSSEESDGDIEGLPKQISDQATALYGSSGNLHGVTLNTCESRQLDRPVLCMAATKAELAIKDMRKQMADYASVTYGSSPPWLRGYIEDLRKQMADQTTAMEAQGTSVAELAIKDLRKQMADQDTAIYGSSPPWLRVTLRTCGSRWLTRTPLWKPRAPSLAELAIAVAAQGTSV
eukprot:gene7626-784_t